MPVILNAMVSLGETLGSIYLGILCPIVDGVSGWLDETDGIHSINCGYGKFFRSNKYR